MRKELEKAISRLKVTRVLYSALIFLIVNIIGVNQVRADAFNEASKLWNKMGGKSVVDIAVWVNYENFLNILSLLQKLFLASLLLN